MKFTLARCEHPRPRSATMRRGGEEGTCEGVKMRKGKPLHRQPQHQPRSGAHRQRWLRHHKKTGEAPSAPSGNSQKPKANDSTKQPAGQRPQAKKREK